MEHSKGFGSTTAEPVEESSQNFHVIKSDRLGTICSKIFNSSL